MGREPDYYEILGVPSTATNTEIRRAFRRRARKLHPDVNPSPDATRHFQELNQAYRVLKVSVTRAMYDAGRYRPSDPHRRPPPPRPSYSTGTQSNRQYGYSHAYRATDPPRPNPRTTASFLRMPMIPYVAAVILPALIMALCADPKAARIVIMVASLMAVLYGFHVFPKGIPKDIPLMRLVALFLGALITAAGLVLMLLTIWIEL